MRHKHGTTSKKGTASSHSEEEASFNLGYFYRTVEEHIESFAAEKGSSFTLPELTEGLGLFLRSKAKDVRQQSGLTELVSQMRAHGAGVDRDGRTQPGEHGHLTTSALHVRPRGRRTLSAKARKAISDAQKARWAKTKRAAKKPVGKVGGKTRNGQSIVPWSEHDDTIIIEGAKGEPQAAPVLARSLMPKLKGRTEGAIRQRMARLVAKGSLKESKSKKSDGGIPHLMVEAA